MGDEVVHDEGLFVALAQVPRVDVDEGFARFVGVEVHHDEDGVIATWGGLAVDEDVPVVGGVEAEVVVLLQSWVLTPSVVQGGDEVLDVARAVPIPDLELVLFRVEILFSSRQGAILT
jgi:hypothetical protein